MSIVKRDYEIVGIPKEEAIEYRKARRTYTSEQGYMEAANWVDAQFPRARESQGMAQGAAPGSLRQAVSCEPGDDAATARNLREDARRERGEVDPRVPRSRTRRCAACSGARAAAPACGASCARRKRSSSDCFSSTTAGTSWASSGRTRATCGSSPRISRWSRSCTRIKLEITDPEGTNVTADITPEMAQNWSRGVYQRGHLYMFPNQATGRFGYSVVELPGVPGRVAAA